VAVVLILVQTKQIRINIHKRNNTKTQYKKIQNTVNTSQHINKTATHYKTNIHAHPHITKQVKTTTEQVKTNTVKLITNSVLLWHQDNAYYNTRLPLDPTQTVKAITDSRSKKT
jgi:hypothetical protein